MSFRRLLVLSLVPACASSAPPLDPASPEARVLLVRSDAETTGRLEGRCRHLGVERNLSGARGVRLRAAELGATVAQIGGRSSRWARRDDPVFFSSFWRCPPPARDELREIQIFEVER